MENKINSLYSDKASYLPNASYKLSEKNKSKHQSKNSNKRSRFVIGAMGRLVKKKGFDFLIKVCAEIDNLDLIIAGDGNEFNNLKKVSEHYNNIKLLGWIKSKDKVF